MHKSCDIQRCSMKQLCSYQQISQGLPNNVSDCAAHQLVTYHHKNHKIEFGKWFSGPWLNLCFIVFPIQQEIKKCCKFSQLSYWCTQDRNGVAARWLFVVRLGGSRRTLHPPYITICESDIITDNIILHNAGSLEVGSITLTVSCHLNSTNTWVGEDTAHSVRASAPVLL